jgi:hypothetical protein
MAGKQSRTEFQQSIQEVKSQIEQTINEVGTGFYPNTNNFRCTAGGFGPVLFFRRNEPRRKHWMCIFREGYAVWHNRD